MPYKDPERQKEYLRKWNKDHPDYLKNWEKENPDKSYKARYYRYVDNNRKKVNARNLLHYAVKTGKLIRPDKCDSCGFKCKPEADHEDYSKPLMVTWLCKACHVATGMKRSATLEK